MLICEDCGIDTERRSNRQKVCPGCRTERRRAAKRIAYTPAEPRPVPDWKQRQSNRHPDDDGSGAPIRLLSRATELQRRRVAAVSGSGYVDETIRPAAGFE